jgi:hypothetical protein
MEDLIERLKTNHGLSDEQSHGVLNTIKDFIKEKFPMIEGAIDNFFPYQEDSPTNTHTGDTGSTEAPASKGGSFLDKM